MEDQVVAVRSGVAELRLDLGAVHDARVALRRLRATLAVFAPVLDDVPSGLVADLRWFARQLATTRDSEVVSERLEARLAGTEDARAATVLSEHLAHWSVDASEGARAALAQPRTDALVTGLGRLHLLVPSAPQIYLDLRTQRLVVRGLEDLCDELPLAIADTGASRSQRARALHACRKQVKTMRAVVDVLGVPAASRTRLSTSLRRLQNLLGEHHDAYMTRRWLGLMAVREPVTAELARTLRAQERTAMDVAEARLPEAVGRLVKQVDRVRRTPGVHLSSP